MAPIGKLENRTTLANNLAPPLDGMTLGPDGTLYLTSGHTIISFDSSGQRLPLTMDWFSSRYRVSPPNLCFLDAKRMVVTSYNYLRGTAILFLVPVESTQTHF